MSIGPQDIPSRCQRDVLLPDLEDVSEQAHHLLALGHWQMFILIRGRIYHMPAGNRTAAFKVKRFHIRHMNLQVCPEASDAMIA